MTCPIHLACARCGVAMEPEANGVTVILKNTQAPYAAYRADRYRCPACGSAVLTGWSDRPVEPHNKEEWDRFTKKKDHIILAP